MKRPSLPAQAGLRRMRIAGRALGAVALLVAALGTQAQTGEPTEAEMRAAYEARLGGINRHTQATADQCRNRAYRQGQGDPVLAMQCLGYAMTTPGAGTRGGITPPQMKATSFRKIACEKAQGEPGYYCDYSAGLSTNLALPPSMAGMLQQAAVAQARFVRRENGWMMMPSRGR